MNTKKTVPMLPTEDTTLLNVALKYLISNAFQEGQVIELGIRESTRKKSPVTGYFNDPMKLADTTLKNIINDPSECYITLNPIKPGLLGRCANKMQKGTFPTTTDSDIIIRRWLVISCSMVEPISVSASDIEKENPLINYMATIVKWLTKREWPKPIIASSGHNVELMYHIELPVEDDGLVAQTLISLSRHFSDKQVRIDTTLSKPVLTWKLFEPLAKGEEDTVVHPSLQLRVDVSELPTSKRLVTKEQLEEVAFGIPVRENRCTIPLVGTPPLDLAGWITKYKLDVTGPKSITGEDGKRSSRWVFRSCPWNPAHTDPSAWILQSADGEISAGCPHEECKGNDWHFLRMMYEPSYKYTSKLFPLTDLGNAERFVAQHGKDLRYCPKKKTWMRWNTKHWEESTGLYVHSRAHLTARSIAADPDVVNNSASPIATILWAKQSEARPRIKSMIDIAEALSGVELPLEKLDVESHLLTCQNGVLDLRSGKLLPFIRDRYLTKILPIEWKDQEYKSTIWEESLNDWTGKDEEMKTYLQKVIGYSMIGDPVERVAFFLYGPTSTGKSTFVRAISNMLGEYALTTPIETFISMSRGSGPRNDLARLPGARIVFASEVRNGQRFDATTLKVLTGRDKIPCRHLYKEYFEFVPSSVNILVGNFAPKIDPKDDAMWKRVRRIPFDQPIAKYNKQLNNELAKPDVLSGILSWAVRGALLWQKEGFTTTPAKVVRSTEEYRHENDPIGAFIKECVVISVKNIDAWTSSQELIRKCKEFTGENGFENVLDRALFDRLRSLGCQPSTKRSDGVTQARGWKGVTLK